jgi:hypothetical protein
MVHMQLPTSRHQFYAQPTAERKVDVLFLGQSSITTWQSAVMRRLRKLHYNSTAQGVPLKFPGWRNSLVMSEYTLDLMHGIHPSSALEAYARQLRNCKVVVLDTSPHRYFTHQISDAMMAGALVIGKTPLELADVFERYAVPVPDQQTVEATVDNIMWQLRHSGSRAQLTEVAQRWVDSELTSRRWFETVTETYYEAITPPFGEGKRKTRSLGSSLCITILGCSAACHIYCVGHP